MVGRSIASIYDLSGILYVYVASGHIYWIWTSLPYCILYYRMMTVKRSNGHWAHSLDVHFNSYATPPKYSQILQDRENRE